MPNQISNPNAQNWSLVIGHWSFRRGFTLAEMLVAMGIFLIFATMSLGVYSATLKAQRRTVAASRIQREAQFLTEFIAKQVRTGTIDYGGYGGTVPSPTATLRLVNQNNIKMVFDYNTGTKAVTLSVAGGPARQVSSSNIIVNSVNYYITPATTPFPGGGSSPSGQPRVTVVLDIQSTVSGQTDNMLVQQTVPQQTAEF